MYIYLDLRDGCVKAIFSWERQTLGFLIYRRRSTINTAISNSRIRVIVQMLKRLSDKIATRGTVSSAEKANLLLLDAPEQEIRKCYFSLSVKILIESSTEVLL